MDEFKQKLLESGFAGELKDDATTREFYSHDASLFEVRPKLVVFPTNSDDVQLLIKSVAAAKKAMPELSVTARSAGTDMSGGAVNESIIVDFNKHFTRIEKVT
ncbi:MAG TPA: FAD-binding protein, partial [Candidatus Saccharimonadales bacterium]|nr:FAD-binding protein [Candidatus Saccharimonadales bacterium]